MNVSASAQDLAVRFDRALALITLGRWAEALAADDAAPRLDPETWLLSQVFRNQPAIDGGAGRR